MDHLSLSPQTLAAQALGETDPATGALAPVITLSTNYEQQPDGSYPQGRACTRADNPTSEHAERLLAALEGGECALSGPVLTAAITTAGRAARALGLSHGPIYAELRIHDRAGQPRPAMLELAARCIGGLCSRALRFPGGQTLEELVLSSALGRAVPAASHVPARPVGSPAPGQKPVPGLHFRRGRHPA